MRGDQIAMSRPLAAAFGSGLGMAGLLTGSFAALPITALLGIVDRERSIAMLVIIGLCAPVTGVLLSAAWSLWSYAATGRQGPLLSPLPLKVFGVAIGLLMGVAVLGLASQGAYVQALVGVGVTAALLSWIVWYLDRISQ